VIEFAEFVRALSVLHPSGDLANKARFAFRMYDLGNTELIEKSDVSKMLDSVLSENPTMYIPEEDLAYIMNQTFEEAERDVGIKDNQITPDDWQRMCMQRPELLSALSLETLRDLTLHYPSFMFLPEDRLPLDGSLPVDPTKATLERSKSTEWTGGSLSRFGIRLPRTSRTSTGSSERGDDSVRNNTIALGRRRHSSIIESSSRVSSTTADRLHMMQSAQQMHSDHMRSTLPARMPAAAAAAAVMPWGQYGGTRRGRSIEGRLAIAKSKLNTSLRYKKQTAADRQTPDGSPTAASIASRESLNSLSRV